MLSKRQILQGYKEKKDVPITDLLNQFKKHPDNYFEALFHRIKDYSVTEDNQIKEWMMQEAELRLQKGPDEQDAMDLFILGYVATKYHLVTPQPASYYMKRAVEMNFVPAILFSAYAAYLEGDGETFNDYMDIACAIDKTGLAKAFSSLKFINDLLPLLYSFASIDLLQQTHTDLVDAVQCGSPSGHYNFAEFYRRTLDDLVTVDKAASKAIADDVKNHYRYAAANGIDGGFFRLAEMEKQDDPDEAAWFAAEYATMHRAWPTTENQYQRSHIKMVEFMLDLVSKNANSATVCFYALVTFAAHSIPLEQRATVEVLFKEHAHRHLFRYLDFCHDEPKLYARYLVNKMNSTTRRLLALMLHFSITGLSRSHAIDNAVVRALPRELILLIVGFVYSHSISDAYMHHQLLADETNNERKAYHSCRFFKKVCLTTLAGPILEAYCHDAQMGQLSYVEAVDKIQSAFKMSAN